jgi:putative membrane protein
MIARHSEAVPEQNPGGRKALKLAAAAYLLLWLALAINPVDRPAWLLENALVFGLFALLWFIRRLFRFSNASLLLILLFLALHTLGSHYTYSEVPYDRWWQALTGHTLNSVFGWERNHYDRLVHFSYGLLLAYPIREFFLRIVEVRGFWAYFLPLDFTLSTSALYELIEWGAAMLFGGDLGMQYLGTQGDIWDAHKDMGLAALGALIAMLAAAAINTRMRRDLAWEWSHTMKKPAADR